MNVAVESDPSHSTCPHCKEVYDGTGLKLAQKIICPHCHLEISHEIKFGDFILKRKLGSGGTCTVYLAYDSRANLEVALKILDEKLAQNPDAVKQFLEESRVTSTLKFPHIINVFRCGDYAGKYFLSMELLTGGSFDDRIVKEGIVPEIDCLKIGIQSAQALQYASARGLLHRDVKPGNILFDSEKRVKVVDFGLSARRGGPNPNTGEIWGTAYYVPPERLAGQNEDLRSDIYGLAASLYHGLTGRPPYSAADPNAEAPSSKPESKKVFSTKMFAKIFAQVACQQQEGKLGQMRKTNPKIFLRTSNAIEKALSPKPKDRFQSYGDFIQAMQDAIRFGPKSMLQPSVPQVPQPK